MASKLLNLSRRIGNLSRNYPLDRETLKLPSQNLRTFSLFSSMSIDSSFDAQHKSLKKKTKSLSTNIIHVGEVVSDEDAKVKRLKVSEISYIEKELNMDYENETTPCTSTVSTSAAPSSTTIFPFEKDASVEDEDTVDIDSLLNVPKVKTIGENKLKKNGKEIVGKENKLNKKEKMLLMYEELRHKGRIQSFNYSLAAYLSVCIHSGFTSSAYETLKHYINIQNKRKDLHKYTKLLNIMPYNEMLKGFAIQGDYKKMKSIRLHLKKSSLKPTHDTFAYILTCLGKEMPSKNNVREIESTFQWMEEQEININEMFEKALLPGDSVKYCLKAVEAVKPDIRNDLTFLNMTLDELQKKYGYNNRLLDSLNNSMFSHMVMSPAEGVVTDKELEQLIKKQINQEKKCSIQIPTIYVEKLSKNSIKNSDLVEKWKVHWRKILQETVVRQKSYMHKHFSSRRGFSLDFYPYFETLDNDEIVDLLMLEISNLCVISEGYSSSLNILYINLGDEFFNRFQMKYKQKTGFLSTWKNVYEKYCNWYLNRSNSDTSYMPRIQWSKMSNDEMMNANLRDVPCDWPYGVKISIGKQLYNIIFNTITVWKPKKNENNGSPAFFKVNRVVDMKNREELKPSPILLEVCRETSQKSISFSTGTLPMLSPPVPWTDMNNGGYYVTKSSFVRWANYANQQKRLIKARDIKNLYPVMDSLNELGSIPWKINTFMLDILIGVFNNKGWAEMDISPPASALPIPPKISGQMSSKEKRDANKLRIGYKKKKAEMNSLWCDTLYKLSIANFYRDCIIWLPQNMDFRGRTYPIPPHMTHISSDVFRSILYFAQGKKLGKEGLYWLKLHVINLTGMKKKCSLRDRLDFFEEVKGEIFDSAKNPLTGNKWWTLSDDPWQTLAACKEVVAALESENPEEFVSHLPIHQDGSCNGLQHYAALGRDEGGAESVNLKPSEIPQDVYSRIADLVEATRQRDAKNDVNIAKILDGYVKRKVIKQTVMTTVYGVTRYGAKLQILKQLNYWNEFPDQHLMAAASYLTSKTFASLGTVFSATKEIQYWLVKVAEGVSKGCSKNVEWITPLGFPVVQSYTKNIPQTITAGKINFLCNDDFFMRPDVKKQKNGFPPNFIHSLDSSHMMLTSIHSQHAGITFVSIHDCFWTHACSVPIMNQICREQFVKLHSEPILEDLADYVRENHSDHMSFKVPFTVVDNKQKASLETLLENVPKKGSFDVNQVIDSTFFFS